MPERPHVLKLTTNTNQTSPANRPSNHVEMFGETVRHIINIPAYAYNTNTINTFFYVCTNALVEAEGSAPSESG